MNIYTLVWLSLMSISSQKDCKIPEHGTALSDFLTCSQIIPPSSSSVCFSNLKPQFKLACEIAVL